MHDLTTERTIQRMNAKAKALLIRDTLRAAARCGVSIQSQAMLAILVAESFPEGQFWKSRLSQARLASRTSTSIPSIRRYTRELEDAALIFTNPGRIRRTTRYWINPQIEGLTLTKKPAPTDRPVTCDGSDPSPVSGQTHHV